MNTAVAEAPETFEADIVVDSTSLNSPIVHDTNPLEVRWAVQVALRDKPLDAHECGISHAPFGRFFPIKSFATPREVHTIDWTKAKEEMTVIQAKACEDFIMEALGGTGAQNQLNWGLRVGFMGEIDAGKMAIISQTLLPKLSTIRAISVSLKVNVIANVCEGSDDLDFGERDECVTCWNKWIKSPAVDAYIERVAFEGRQVSTRNPQTGETTQTVVKPTIAEFQKGKEIIIAAMALGMRTLEAQWRIIMDECDRVNGRQPSEFEHVYRKDLHQQKPGAVAPQIAVAQPAQGAGGNDALLNALVDGQIQLTKAVAAIAKSRGPVEPSAPEIPIAPTGAPSVASPTSAVAEPPVVDELPQTEASEPVADGLTDLAGPAARMQAAKNNKNKEK